MKRRILPVGLLRIIAVSTVLEKTVQTIVYVFILAAQILFAAS